MPNLTTPHGVVSYDVTGSGPWLFLGYPFTASRGNAMLTDHDLRDLIVDRLADRYRVITVDYPRGVGQSSPAVPSALSVHQVQREMLGVADVAGADTFTWWGYSWGGLNGLNLACHTARVDAIIVGGYAPLTTDFADLLAMSSGLENAAREVGAADALVRFAGGFRTFYEDLVLRPWPQDHVRALSIPRMTYVGADDRVDQGGITVDVAGRWRAQRNDLTALGWETHEITGPRPGDGTRGDTAGMGHVETMMAADDVLAVVEPFLASVHAGAG